MWRDDANDILQDHWAEAQKFNNDFLHEVIDTLIDSFIDDDPHVFVQVIDAAYEDMWNLPDGKPRMILTSLIDQLAELPIE